MIAALTNHLWQSTLFVLAAALVATALRKNGAHIRHRIWLIASMKFLVPLSILMSLGAALPRITPATPALTMESGPDYSVAVDLIAQPFSSDIAASTFVPRAEADWTLPLVASIWSLGFVAVVSMRVRGWRHVRAALRSSHALAVDAPVPVRSSPGLLEPGVVGFWRPVLLVPEGIERQLTPKQLEAVLLHEWCHVQRRDNLTSAVHMLVEAVFWFHPLVWFIGARLVDERERACDEFVLKTAGDPSAYAESILSVCKLYVESPVACVSGVTGADLKKRIATILTNRIGLQLTSTRKVALTLAACVAVALPVMAGVLTAPLRATSAPTDGQGSAKFDVVSVKPCPADMPGQLRNGGGSPITSPGRLYLQCYRVSGLITEAYLYFADGRAHNLSSVIDVGVEGGPSWISSERFLIEATGPRDAPPALMRGPMLQAILEDRFKLKIRRVSREMPVYELVAAASGAKVAPYKGTDCVIKDDAAWPPPAPPEGQRYCGDRSRIDGDLFIREGVMKLDELASLMRFDRPVVNKTGITAPVSYRFALPKTEVQGGEPPPSGAYLSVLRSELGLDLRPSKGPRDFLVIDSIERPTPDPPSPSGWPSLAEGSSTQAAGGFDVVSIKRCAGLAERPSSGRGAGPDSAQTSPGYAYWDCVTLDELVEQAYASADQPLLNVARDGMPSSRLLRDAAIQGPSAIRGGPSWVRSDRFTIEVKASADTISAQAGRRNLKNLPPAMSRALRAMLEDRFQLRVRRATEPAPMYALSVSAGGLKLERAVPGECQPWTADMGRGASEPWAVLDRPVCGVIYSGFPSEKLARVLAGGNQQAVEAGDGPNRRNEFTAVTMPTVVRYLSMVMDHIVLDKAAIDGEFTFAIEYETTGSTPGAGLYVNRDWKLKPESRSTRKPVGRGGTIFKALEQLGLKLESTKGPSEYLVIERAEKPTPNLPATEALLAQGAGSR